MTQTVPGIEFVVTRYDINKLFKRCREVGLFARQNYWCCNSCGTAALHTDMRPKHVGWMFYHQQDADAFVWDGVEDHVLRRPLWLTYGDPKGNPADTVTVGNMIVAIMSELGLQTDWDGNPNTRINVLPMGIQS